MPRFNALSGWRRDLWEGRERCACEPLRTDLVVRSLGRSLFVVFRLRWVLVPCRRWNRAARWVSTSMTTRPFVAFCPLRAGAQRVLSLLFSIACHHFACRPLFFINHCDLSLSASLLSLFRVSCFSVRNSTHTGKTICSRSPCATWHIVPTIDCHLQ